MKKAFSEKNPKYFYERREFPELKILEENYQIILNELRALRKNSTDGFWLETFPGYVDPASKNKWKVFTFQYMQIRHPLNCSLCPETAELLSRIPGLLSADFSYLPGRTKINEHVGFTPAVLRVHLGLIIPGNCGIRVGNETRKWEEGKLLIFDDSFEHAAWNDSDKDRFVLMMDIKNPRYPYSTEEISSYEIQNMKEKFMLDMFSKEQWLEFYEKREFTLFPAK